jgi:hypothetical protein
MRDIGAAVAGALLAVIVGWSAAGVSPALSADYYPWCARYGGGGDSPGVPSCGFSTQAQCMAAVQGLGGYCEQNWPQTSRSARGF